MRRRQRRQDGGPRWVVGGCKSRCWVARELDREWRCINSRRSWDLAANGCGEGQNRRIEDATEMEQVHWKSDLPEKKECGGFGGGERESLLECGNASAGSRDQAKQNDESWRDSELSGTVKAGQESVQRWWASRGGRDPSNRELGLSDGRRYSL